MDSKNKIPHKGSNQEKKEKAINIKGTPDDGEKINDQVEDLRNKHRPRDNA
ncbi:MAG: hypothetical protein HKN90_09370 [Flavobacteriaceae bacterium]|nr:hypothetical protein [Flavobacteriaceae bacterium]